jgi:hypothetical protein
LRPHRCGPICGGPANYAAFVLTHGGSSPDKALREMQALAGAAPVGTLVVREADVKAGAFGPAVASFAQLLRRSAAAARV